MTFWLSFANDDGFLGGCLIDDDDFLGACAKARTLGINPGGEVKGFSMNEKEREDFGDPELDRLYSKEEIESELGGAERF